MTLIYDSDASLRRWLKSQEAVGKQETYISSLTSSEGRDNAAHNLRKLIEARVIAEKNHLLILDILAAKNDFELESSQLQKGPIIP